MSGKKEGLGVCVCVCETEKGKEGIERAMESA